MNTARTLVTVTCLALSLFLLLTAGERPPEPELWRSIAGR